jgi:phosphoribosylanthranilate isomerase
MKLKICGLTREEDVSLAVAIGASYLGFIFVKDTPRAMDLDKASDLIKDIPQSKHPVAVILHDDSRAQEYLDRGFHYLQVIGGLVSGIDREKQIPVYPVSAEKAEGKDDPELKLFDTQVKGQLGGTGKQFDLSLLNGALEPYFVAGGFKPGNLEEVKKLNPFAIDVSSGLEKEERIKDPEKVKKFVKELWETK